MSIEAYLGLFLTHCRWKKVLTGITAFLANHGVPQTLTISLTGSSTFVTAYAAVSLLPPSANFIS